ncbi:MAG: AAA family ATPase [Candidatus Omnitrophica bacterium]|nr:AAA family ATPase [Candidatus Omnitrophota bacterium]MDD5670688.1 AAA family ATPase [Candidatus Omnitrophota bacterium]
MENIFSFCNQKGGVGKTTSVINIGSYMATMGYKVLILDMDSQANTTSGLGVEKPSIEFTTYQLIVEKVDPRSLVKNTKIENLQLIPSNADLAGAEINLINTERREYQLHDRMESISKEYDFVLIDCPPSLGLTTINCLNASGYIIIPLQCEYYALEGLSQLLHTFQLVQSKLNPSLQIGGVLLTMADLRTNLTQQVIEEVKNYFKEKVFSTVIPRSVKISEAPSFGQPAIVYDPTNRGSKAYCDVGCEFAKRFASRQLPLVDNAVAEDNQNPVIKDSERPFESVVGKNPEEAQP